MSSAKSFQCIIRGTYRQVSFGNFQLPALDLGLLEQRNQRKSPTISATTYLLFVAMMLLGEETYKCIFDIGIAET
jgi:hypothetical protein